MVELPTALVEPLLQDPRCLLIYSKPKVGKTPCAVQLPNSLTIDLEGSTDYLAAPKVKVIGLKPPSEKDWISAETTEQVAYRHGRVDIKGLPKHPEYYLTEVIMALQQKPLMYKYGVLDTITKLAEWCEHDATLMYMRSPIGKNFNRWSEEDQSLSGGTNIKGYIKPLGKWESVLTLPKGAGYMWLRESFVKWLGYIQPLFKTLILLGHVKINMTTSKKNGAEVENKDLDLSGQLKNITTGQIADANGYLYRQGRKNYLSFQPSDELYCGSRIAHLEGKEILLSEKLDDGTIKVYWHNIFKELA